MRNGDRNSRDDSGEIGAKTSCHPPLENGDLLTRAEFERRYEAMPWLKKAELVEGVVYMGSPVRSEVHAESHALIRQLAE